MIHVLFVCMGNICRSPSAEAVFRSMVEQNQLVDQIQVASAGTHDAHVGHRADKRSAQVGLERGLDLSAHRAQHIKAEHFKLYDYILVMDQANHAHVIGMCPAGQHHKVHYLMDFAPQLGVREVPDPYFGGEDGFENVLDLIQSAAAGLLSDIRDRHLSPPPVHREIHM